MKEKLNPYFAALADSSKNDFNGYGEGCDWLSWADPFYPESKLPQHIYDACVAALDGPGAHYTLPMGLEPLRHEIARKLKEVNGLDVDGLKNVFIVGGSDTGLFYAMMPFITPGAGDEVLVFTPSYMGNFTDVALLGAVLREVELDEERDFAIDFKKLEAAVTDKTKLLVLTNPNNPTGRSHSKEELMELAGFVKRHDLAVVVDQAFEDCVFEGNEMVTLAALPGMLDRTVTVFTTSKGMALCGFRVAYIVSSERFSSAYQKACVAVCGAPNTVAQYGALAAFQNQDFMKQYTKVYENRTLRSWKMLQGIPGVRCHKPQAGYFLWLDVSSLGEVDEVLEYIAKEANVILSGGSGFGSMGEGHLRLITVSLNDDEKYFDAIVRLRVALENLSKSRYNYAI
jgi:aspartate/methionine/tyrosine aminotransferase